MDKEKIRGNVEVECEEMWKRTKTCVIIMTDEKCK